MFIDISLGQAGQITFLIKKITVFVILHLFDLIKIQNLQYFYHLYPLSNIFSPYTFKIFAILIFYQNTCQTVLLQSKITFNGKCRL